MEMSRDEEFEKAVQEGLKERQKKEADKKAFDDGWLTFKEGLRKTFTAARDALKKHKIEAAVSDPNGNVYLEAVWVGPSRDGRYVHKLTCDKDKDALKIVLTSSLHPDIQESFGLDVGQNEIESRIKKFLREVGEAGAASPEPSFFVV
jgi:hypothetical protein